MFERVVSLEVSKAYEELKDALLKRDCKIVGEVPPRSIAVEQGSLWGLSPKGVKKRVTFDLFPYDSKTRVVSFSSLTSDWIGLSVVGYALLVVLGSMLGWIAADLEAYIMARRQSFWGWLAEALGYTGFREALVMVGLLKVLSIVCFVVLIVGIIVDAYCYAKRDSFSEEVLRSLP
jgi:hypothetical protein